MSLSSRIFCVGIGVKFFPSLFLFPLFFLSIVLGLSFSSLFLSGPVSLCLLCPSLVCLSYCIFWVGISYFSCCGSPPCFLCLFHQVLVFVSSSSLRLFLLFFSLVSLSRVFCIANGTNFYHRLLYASLFNAISC